MRETMIFALGVPVCYNGLVLLNRFTILDYE